MAFSKKIKEDVLVSSGRHCCLCHKFCGTKIEIHHIKQKSEGGKDTFDNAIALCFDCHADMKSYDFKHPRGTKYSENELKEHRNKWYRKVENKIGIANQREIIETDKKVFEKLVSTLPWDGSIGFIRMLDFHNSFETDALNDFHEFIYRCENPAFEFIDPDLEGIRLELLEKIKTFVGLIEIKTFPTHQPKRNSVLEEWREDKPKLYYETVKVLNNSSVNTCDCYDNLIKTTIRKLGIIPENLIDFKPLFVQVADIGSKPFCPNCSTAQKKIYMSSIPDVFAKEMNANYECTKCGYSVMIK